LEKLPKTCLMVTVDTSARLDHFRARLSAARLWPGDKRLPASALHFSCTS